MQNVYNRRYYNLCSVGVSQLNIIPNIWNIYCNLKKNSPTPGIYALDYLLNDASLCTAKADARTE